MHPIYSSKQYTVWLLPLHCSTWREREGSIPQSFTPQVQSKESIFLRFPELPQVRLWSPVVDTAPWLHPLHWPHPTARPTSSKHYRPESSPQRLLLREPKLRRNFFKPRSVNSLSLLSSQILFPPPTPFCNCCVFSTHLLVPVLTHLTDSTTFFL